MDIPSGQTTLNKSLAFLLYIIVTIDSSQPQTAYIFKNLHHTCIFLLKTHTQCESQQEHHDQH